VTADGAVVRREHEVCVMWRVHKVAGVRVRAAATRMAELFAYGTAWRDHRGVACYGADRKAVVPGLAGWRGPMSQERLSP
jgi:hypothetical protein